MAKNKPGRPRIQIDLKEVERLAGEFNTEAQIAEILGISRNTLMRRKKEFCDFCDSIKKGKEKSRSRLINGFFKLVDDGNPTAIIFGLKSICGWQEKQTIDHTSSDGSMRTTPQPITVEFIDSTKKGK